MQGTYENYRKPHLNDSCVQFAFRFLPSGKPLLLKLTISLGSGHYLRLPSGRNFQISGAKILENVARKGTF